MIIATSTIIVEKKKKFNKYKNGKIVSELGVSIQNIQNQLKKVNGNEIVKYIENLIKQNQIIFSDIFYKKEN